MIVNDRYRPKAAGMFILILGLASAMISAGTAGAPEDMAQVHRLSERVLVLTSDTPTFNNVTAIATQKGIVVVDTTPSPETASQLRRVIEETFGRSDFVYTINTHHHVDHFFGNQAFADTMVIAHDRAPQRMRDLIPETGHPAPWLKGSAVDDRKTELSELDPESERAGELRREISWFLDTYEILATDFKPTYPTVTFNDRLTLDMGDVTIQLHYYGQADSDNSIVVHVPEEGLLVAGDLYWYGGMFSDFGDGLDLQIERWVETLERVLGDEGDIQWLVGGHENIWPGEYLELRRDYIVRLWKSVKHAHESGLSLEQTQETLAASQFPELEKLGFAAAIKAHGWPPDWYPLSQQHADNIRTFWAQFEPTVAP